jgi:uncharacterized protein with FMN-binding domain
MKLPAHQKMLSAAAAASVMLLTAACGSGSDDASAPAGSSTSAAPSADSSDSSGTYKDGEYEAEASYVNPGGESTVKVDLTIADNAISAVEVTPMATNGESRQYQAKFAGGIADVVIGKSLDELNVSKVAGSSLTAQGFNQAVDDIKADAQA